MVVSIAAMRNQLSILLFRTYWPQSDLRWLASGRQRIRTGRQPGLRNELHCRGSQAKDRQIWGRSCCSNRPSPLIHPVRSPPT